METSELTLHKAVSETGLSKSKAEQIEKTFLPMVKMLKEFEAAYNEVIGMEISPAVSVQASRLRKDIAKIRTATENVRKAEKSEYLMAGRAIDGAASILKWAVTDKEEKLKEIETYYDRLEAKRIEDLHKTRAIEVGKYDVDGDTISLGDMPDDVFSNFLSGLKVNHEAKIKAEKEAEEARIAAEKKAEDDRIAREKEQEAERVRMKAENERMKKEAEEYEKERNIERVRQAKKDAARIEAQKKERAEFQAKLAAQQEEKDRIEKELRDKREEDQRVQDEKERSALEAQAAPDKKKLEKFITDLKQVEIPEMKTAKMVKVVEEIASKLISTINLGDYYINR